MPNVIGLMRRLATTIVLAIALTPAIAHAGDAAAPLETKVVQLGNGISLHYVEQGAGPTVILIHGSLSDFTYWQGQIPELSKRYHVIAYSRRYNPPNRNPPVSGYSAVTDADDLLGLIGALHLGQVAVIGHSYGALTALFAEARNPAAFNAVILAEPPAMSLLEHVPGAGAQEAHAMYEDVQARMVKPMKQAFEQGDVDRGVGVFIDYVFRDPQAWEKFSAEDRAAAVRGAEEWKVMLPRGTFFPEITPEEIRSIRVPTLLMSGAQSYLFLRITDGVLASLIPHAQRIIFSDAGHQMWLQHPAEARAYAEAFIEGHKGGQSPFPGNRDGAREKAQGG